MPVTRYRHALTCALSLSSSAALADPSPDCNASTLLDAGELDATSDCNQDGVLDFCETIPWIDERYPAPRISPYIWRVRATATGTTNAHLVYSTGKTSALVRQDYDLFAHALGPARLIPLPSAPTTEWARDFELVDVDHDGRLDIVALVRDTVYVVPMEADPPATTQMIALPGACSSRAMAARDLDGDGWVDVVTASGCTTVIRNANGVLQPATAIAHPYLGSATRLLVEDLDGDQRPDAVVYDDDGEIIVLRGPLTSAAPAQQPYQLSAPALRDPHVLDAVALTSVSPRQVVFLFRSGYNDAHMQLTQVPVTSGSLDVGAAVVTAFRGSFTNDGSPDLNVLDLQDDGAPELLVTHRRYDQSDPLGPGVTSIYAPSAQGLRFVAMMDWGAGPATIIGTGPVRALVGTSKRPTRELALWRLYPTDVPDADGDRHPDGCVRRVPDEDPPARPVTSPTKPGTGCGCGAADGAHDAGWVFALVALAIAGRRIARHHQRDHDRRRPHRAPAAEGTDRCSYHGSPPWSSTP